MRLHVVHGYQNVLGAIEPGIGEGLDFSDTLSYDSWVAEDVSAGGYGVIVPAGKGEWLRVGVILALRGEMDAACGLQASSVKTSYMAEVNSGEMQFFVQFGAKPEPLFADATMMYSMIKNDEDRKIADLIFGQTEIARPLAAPPGTPKDRVAALRKAMLDKIGRAHV